MTTNSTTYLTRTQSSGTSDKIGTFSAWIKSPQGNETNSIFSGHTDSSNRIALYIGGSGALTIYGNIANSQSVYLITNNLLRDVSAWYHIVVAWDTTQGTDSNRFKIYVNGSQITSFSTASYPSVDADVYWNKGTTSIVGARYISSAVNFYYGSMAMVQFVDGTALGPEYFGSTDSTTGIWTPQASSTISSYGTNGFKLKMDTATPGADTSGNTNTFTVGGGTPTLTQGSPSNVYATLNPLVTYGTNQNTLSEGNTTLTGIAYHRPSPPTISVSKGKWYFEAKALSGTATKWWIGLCDTDYDTNNQGAIGSTANYIWGYDNTTNAVNQRSQCIYANDLRDGGGNIAISSIFSAGGIAVNDIYAMAVDLDNQKVWYSKNGVWNNGSGGESTTFNASYPDSTNIDAGRDYLIGIGGENSKFSINYGEGFFGTTAAGTQADDNGQGLFAYDVPAGYYALNTKNLEAYG